jgi:CBS domain-containing protein
MSASLFVIEVGMSPAEAAAVLAAHRISGAPVVSGSARPLGIVTRSDLLRALLAVAPAPPPMSTDDVQIRVAILAELAKQKWAGKDMIDVTVDKGMVELSGAIFDERERQAAIVAAENVAGVRAVRDRLFCADPFSVVLVS